MSVRSFKVLSVTASLITSFPNVIPIIAFLLVEEEHLIVTELMLPTLEVL